MILRYQWTLWDCVCAHPDAQVQWMLAIIQSLTIPIACTLFAYNSFISGESISLAVLQPAAHPGNPYVAELAPSAAVLVLSFVIARSFSSVYEQVITALTVCVLHDIDVLERPVAHMRNDIREAFEIPRAIDAPHEVI